MVYPELIPTQMHKGGWLMLRLMITACLLWTLVAPDATRLNANVGRSVQSSQLGSSSMARIAFGSCARQAQADHIWDLIAATNPDLLLLLGDNVYADTRDPNVMQAAYDQLADRYSFAAIRKQIPILATWDDHDYGENDAGSDYPMRDQAQRIFNQFWYPDSDELNSQEGIYHSRRFQVGRLQVQVIMLDTRYHRSALKRGLWGYRENNDPQATILGRQQWQWLEALLSQPADLRLIGSSIQFVAKDHSYEKWANFPLERQRLLDLIAETKAGGVIFLSGDRHHAEISKLNRKDIAYPIYDITSSGLSNRLDPAINTEYNEYRIDNSFAYRQRNFATIDIQDGGEPSLRLAIHDAYGDELASTRIKLRELHYYQRYAQPGH